MPTKWALPRMPLRTCSQAHWNGKRKKKQISNILPVAVENFQEVPAFGIYQLALKLSSYSKMI
jgi:hypothetical protein